ncbi:MAG: VTT domain-containing protein [Proteobacteria bacterium]|nr:VTT domain-containing protein [Pseudomonadota bacterium]
MKLLRPGETCWQAPRASRAAVLVDGRAYFAAFASAVARARRSVLIAGWDIDSRVELWRDGGVEGLPPRLGDFLNAVVARREGLHVHALGWDFAMIYALEREPLPVFQLGWRTHRRVHFHLDGRHPVGACHHQKIVVVDDALAFAGGLDLAENRWDTPAHEPDDHRRRTASGAPYGPFHDVQLMVEGEAAAALGELIRERWRWATGKRLKSPEPAEDDRWPEGVEPDFEDVAVGIARTLPAYDGRPEAREVEALHQEAIAAAKHVIYVENQYLTSRTICTALERRLAERDGPEVVLVLPRQCSGWLEQSTMGILRSRLLETLRRANRFDRLQVYYPHVPGLGKTNLNVHAKVMIVDDVLLRVGSANLSNRSMGFDTECDLAVEGTGREVRRRITGVRDRLLAEHLGTSAEEVAQAVRDRGTLAAAVRALGGSGRELRPLPEDKPWLEPLLPGSETLDPEQPAEVERLIDEFEPEERDESGHRLLAAGGLLLVLAALAAAWRWTPLGEWADRETLTRWVTSISHTSMAPVWVLGFFLAGGLVSFPVVLLILITTVVFGPLLGFAYALVGAMASALATYALGGWLGRDAVRKLAGPRLNRLSKRLARRGFLAVLAVRVVPVAPFTVVNLVAGASHIRLRDFALGTMVGMAPGTLLIALFGDRLKEAVVDPGGWSIAVLAVLALALFLGVRWLQRRLEP